MEQHVQLPHENKFACRLYPLDKLVYVIMKKYMDKDTKRTYISAPTIAEIIGDKDITVKKVITCISHLKKAKAIKAVGKHGRSTIHEFLPCKLFEMFSYDFLDLNEDDLTASEKMVIISMQEFCVKDSGKLAFTYSLDEMSNKIHMGYTRFANVIKSLERKGVLTTKSLQVRDPLTGMTKTKYSLDIEIIKQAIIFVNEKTDYIAQVAKKNSDDIQDILKEYSEMKQRLEHLEKTLKVNPTKEYSF